jgi:hypothetical protein
MACMFCKSEEDLTREHVFPAFMGGELTVPAVNTVRGQYSLPASRAEPGHPAMDIGCDCSFGHSGTQLSLGPSKVGHQK